jgi:hypothetical protein
LYLIWAEKVLITRPSRGASSAMSTYVNIIAALRGFIKRSRNRGVWD